ncbi:hypothetical protein K8I28_09570 [bacterium]|nr:hypothetical protein [bacterium]
MKSSFPVPQEKFQNRLNEIRQRIEEEIDPFQVAKIIVTEAHNLFQVDDAQLTLYYDLSIGMEVSHVRLHGDDFKMSVERVREDEEWGKQDDTEFLSPGEAKYSEMLAQRDRLVGQFMLGSRVDGEEFGQSFFNLMQEFIPLVTNAIEQVMLIRKVSEANQKLFEAEKLVTIGQLASGIAHEIRNPLSSLKINLQGLYKADLDERNRRRVKICLDEIHRLDNTVSEVTQYAKRTRLDLCSSSIAELVEHSLNLTTGEVVAHHIEVSTNIPAELPTIMVDQNKIIRALMNLIVNAAQAMGESGKLSINADSVGDGVVIKLEDSGPGIPEENLRDVFNPFFTTKAEGTGLGLANALKAVQEHGGELEVTSEPGKGAVFTMRLPSQPPTMQYPFGPRIVMSTT